MSAATDPTKKRTTKSRKPGQQPEEVYQVPQVLSLEDVGVYLGMRKGGKPYSGRTVGFFVSQSVPGGRYGEHPFPAPSGYVGRQKGKETGGIPYWLPNRLGELEQWDDTRPGRGGGASGRPRLPRPLLDDGYVPCAECDDPIERHLRDGCHPRKGRCKCEAVWTVPKIRGARAAAGLPELFTVEGSTV
jgi:hypothetical protein